MHISICASAIRPKNWEKVLQSLKSNTMKYEVIFVGDIKPEFDLSKYPEFTYIYSSTKPAQCYQIAFNQAQGELIGWTADDCVYPPNAIDNMYNFYNSFNNNKIVAAFRTVEDGRDITEVHRFRGRDNNSPRMAPFGVVNRELFNQLGGYDRRFVCGQSENDVVMRFLEIGGSVEISNIPIYVEHQKNHDSSGTVFRSGWFHKDREILEDAWIQDGKILTRRKYPVESFNNEEILTKTQSNKGSWI
mgnify:CR=1 FL=1